MQNMPSREAVQTTRAWNALVASRAINVEVTPQGVSYLHPTKGYRFVSAKRFAAYGVSLDA